MMTEPEPIQEFGKRKPVAPATGPAPKRSCHVALLLMGSFAVGGGAYALMPKGCEPPAPATAAPGVSQSSGGCLPHGSSGGFYSRSSRFSFFGDGSSGRGSSATSSDAASGSVSRGGFGSFARAFGFSGSG